MSLVTSAEQIRAAVEAAGGDDTILRAAAHEHSRGRWQTYRNCEGCRSVAQAYDRARKREQRSAWAELRCPCPSCQRGK